MTPEQEISQAIKTKVLELNELVTKANELGLTVFVSNDSLCKTVNVVVKKFVPAIEY